MVYLLLDFDQSYFCMNYDKYPGEEDLLSVSGNSACVDSAGINLWIFVI